MRTLRLRTYRRTGRRGFSLVELSITLIINLIAFAGAFSVFIASSKLQRDIFNHNLIDGEARKVENWLVSDIRSAMTLEDSFTHGGKTYTKSNQTLILRLPAVKADGTPVNMGTTPAGSASDFIVYYHDASNNLRRLLVRHAQSFRDGSNVSSEDRLMGRSSTPGISFASAFSAAPDILGPIVVHYQFYSTRIDSRRGTAPNPYTLAVSGSVYLRNRPNVL